MTNDETNENGIKAEKDGSNSVKDQNANDDNNEDVKKSANDNNNSVNDQNDSEKKSKLYTLVNEIIDHEYDNEAACQKKLASSVNLMKQKAEALDEFVTSLCNKTGKLSNSFHIALYFQQLELHRLIHLLFPPL